MNYLALLYWRQEKIESAEPLFVGCLDKRRYILGHDHPDTISSSFNLALMYININAYGIARELLKDCVERRVRVLGEDHKDTVTAREYLDKVCASVLQ